MANVFGDSPTQVIENLMTTPRRNRGTSGYYREREMNENCSPLRSPLRREKVEQYGQLPHGQKGSIKRFRFKPQEFPPLPSTPEWSSPSQASSPGILLPEKIITPIGAEIDGVSRNEWEYKVQDFESKARKEYEYKVQDFEFRARKEYISVKKHCRKLELERGNKEKDERSLEEVETDPNTLMRRQKDIDYGKNTIGYDNYVKLIPKPKRKKSHPKTPNKYQKCSRRSWDGQMKHWRILLHQFDNISNVQRCNSVASDNLSETSSVNNSEGIEEVEEEDIDFDIDVDVELSLDSPPASPHKARLAAPSPLQESSQYNVNGQLLL